MQFLQALNKSASSSLTSSPFSPFLANNAKIQGNADFRFGRICYNQKHNMIIACASDETIRFYDAVTLEPLKERPNVKLGNDVLSLSFHPETDTYILGCTSGAIYEYNASENELRLLKQYNNQIIETTFLSSGFYAFSVFHSKQLRVCNKEEEEAVTILTLRNHDAFCLYHFAKSNLLFAGLSNGDVRIYRTDKLPQMKVADSVPTRERILTIQTINVNGKDYVVTSGRDENVKIWHFFKGKMRLLRVIFSKGLAVSVIYLEEYKMITISQKSKYVRFFSFVSGKWERNLDLGSNDEHQMFLMQDKKMIGVTSKNGNCIKFVKLCD